MIAAGTLAWKPFDQTALSRVLARKHLIDSMVPPKAQQDTTDEYHLPKAAA